MCGCVLVLVLCVCVCVPSVIKEECYCLAHHYCGSITTQFCFYHRLLLLSQVVTDRVLFLSQVVFCFVSQVVTDCVLFLSQVVFCFVFITCCFVLCFYHKLFCVLFLSQVVLCFFFRVWGWGRGCQEEKEKEERSVFWMRCMCFIIVTIRFILPIA